MIKSTNLGNLLLALTFLLLVSSGCAQNSNMQLVQAQNSKQAAPRNYSECVAAGFPALRSYPGKCIANGQTFIDDKAPLPNFKDSGKQDFKEKYKDICVNQCGNGECQEMVCMGSGCPCAETFESCPQDCAHR